MLKFVKVITNKYNNKKNINKEPARLLHKIPKHQKKNKLFLCSHLHFPIFNTSGGHQRNAKEKGVSTSLQSK